MRSILQAAVLAATTFSSVVMAGDSFADDNTGGQNPLEPADGITVRTPVDLGCFSAPGKDWYDMGVYTFQSDGWCHDLCLRQAKTYFANVNGTNCFCGSQLPPSSAKLSSNKTCNTPCAGVDTSYCGGTNLWQAYDGQFRIGDPTGSQKITVPAQTYTYIGAAASTSASDVQQTVIITQGPTTTATSTPTSAPQTGGGSNTAGIAAGVVVGVLALFAIVGGVFFFMRRQKQKAIAEEQRRHEMMTSFVTGEKPPGSGYTSPDSRLDPSLMFSRRLSDGSIRDNEDYSRRILKVANPDA